MSADVAKSGTEPTCVEEIIANHLGRSWADRADSLRRAREIRTALNHHAAEGCPRCARPDDPAARASQPPADAQVPGDGAGDGQDARSAAAGRTEARDTVKRHILEAIERWHEAVADTAGEFAGVMEAVDDYAAAIEQRVREQVAAEILDRAKAALATKDAQIAAIARTLATASKQLAEARQQLAPLAEEASK